MSSNFLQRNNIQQPQSLQLNTPSLNNQNGSMKFVNMETANEITTPNTDKVISIIAEIQTEREKHGHFMSLSNSQPINFTDILTDLKMDHNQNHNFMPYPITFSSNNFFVDKQIVQYQSRGSSPYSFSSPFDSSALNFAPRTNNSECTYTNTPTRNTAECQFQVRYDPNQKASNKICSSSIKACPLVLTSSNIFRTRGKNVDVQ